MININDIPEDDTVAITGTLTELQVDRSWTNALEKYQQNASKKAGLAGAAGAVLGNAGSAASAAIVAMYDGDETENFVGLIDGVPICGQFDGASQLPKNGEIKAVVRRKGDLLIAEAMLSPRRGWCWINHPTSGLASRRDEDGLAFNIPLFTAVVMLLMGIASGFGSETFLIWGGD